MPFQGGATIPLAYLRPLTYAAVMATTSNDHRLSIFATGGFFVLALGLVAAINMERGRTAVQGSLDPPDCSHRI